MLLADYVDVEQKAALKVVHIEPSVPTASSNSCEVRMQGETLIFQLSEGSKAALAPAGNQSDLTQVKSLIADESPISAIQKLGKGFDGHRGEPPSDHTISEAQKFWDALKRSLRQPENLPRVEAGSDDFVDFTWMGSYPAKRLQIWVYGSPTLRAEWCLDVAGAEPEDGEVDSQADLLAIVGRYLKA